MSFQSFKKILPDALVRAGIDSEVSAARVLEEARHALVRIWGEERASYIEPAVFKDGELRLDTSSASAAQMFRTIEGRLINEINRTMAQRKVLKVSVRKKGF